MVKMPLAEFVEIGLLQELNRRYLHPMGLAMYVIITDEGEVMFGGIEDYRDSDDGVIFDESIIGNNFYEKYEKIEKMFHAKENSRRLKLGYHVQPISNNLHDEKKKDDE